MSESATPRTAAARLPCPSLSPGICWNSCPLSLWCYPMITTSATPFFFASNLSQNHGLFQWLDSSQQVAKVLKRQHQSFQYEYSRLIAFRIDWFDLLTVQRTLKSLLQHHSLKALILWCSAFFMVQLSHLYMTTEKTTISQEIVKLWTFDGKVMSLLFNTLFRFVITFFPKE